MSAFDWNGFELVAPDKVPPQFTTEGKTIAIPNAGPNGERPLDADLALSYYVQEHFGQGLAGDLVNRLVEDAKQKGVTVESFKVTGNDGANSRVEVSISAENLAKLREIAPYYQQLAAKGQAASEAGQREVNHLAKDTIRVFHNAARNVGDGLLNIVPDTLNLPLFPEFSPRTGSEPNFGRAKAGEMYDTLAQQRDPNATGGPIPRIPFPLPRAEYQSQMMKRDGGKIEMGVTLAAPLAIGKATAPGQMTRLNLTFPLRTGQSAKIGVVNMTGELDPFVARDFGRITAENPVATRAYAQMQRTGTDVTLDFGRPPDNGTFGIFEHQYNRATIFMRNNGTAKEAVSTMTHESSHARRFFRNGIRQPTQYEEYRAFRREFLFQEGQRPTLQERLKIWKETQVRYPRLPKGRNPFSGGKP
jgi:hypothetical protein